MSPTLPYRMLSPHLVMQYEALQGACRVLLLIVRSRCGQGWACSTGVRHHSTANNRDIRYVILESSMASTEASGCACVLAGRQLAWSLCCDASTAPSARRRWRTFHEPLRHGLPGVLPCDNPDLPFVEPGLACSQQPIVSAHVLPLMTPAGVRPRLTADDACRNKRADYCPSLKATHPQCSHKAAGAWSQHFLGNRPPSIRPPGTR